jgi:hypothetical protein
VTAPAANGGEQVSDGTVFGQWCSWHHGAALSRPVAMIERGPGAGGTLYACRPCRIKHGFDSIPTFMARAALFNHLRGTDDTPPCLSCSRYERCPEGDALWAELRRQRRADQRTDQ